MVAWSPMGSRRNGQLPNPSATAEYDETILQSHAEEPAGGSDDEPVDELYDKAVSIVAEAQQASVSMVQRSSSHRLQPSVPFS